MSSLPRPVLAPGGHMQTIYASALMPRPRVAYRRERWDTPDGDFIDLDWVSEPPDDGVLGDDNSSSQGSMSATRAPPGVASPRGPLLRPSTRSHQTPAEANRPLVVLFHGLEGSSRSHYSLALMAALRERGLRGVTVHFRGCSGQPNLLPARLSFGRYAGNRLDPAPAPGAKRGCPALRRRRVAGGQRAAEVAGRQWGIRGPYRRRRGRGFRCRSI